MSWMLWRWPGQCQPLFTSWHRWHEQERKRRESLKRLDLLEVWWYRLCWRPMEKSKDQSVRSCPSKAWAGLVAKTRPILCSERPALEPETTEGSAWGLLGCCRQGKRDRALSEPQLIQNKKTTLLPNCTTKGNICLPHPQPVLRPARVSWTLVWDIQKFGRLIVWEAWSFTWADKRRDSVPGTSHRQLPRLQQDACQMCRQMCGCAVTDNRYAASGSEMLPSIHWPFFFQSTPWPTSVSPRTASLLVWWHYC